MQNISRDANIGSLIWNNGIVSLCAHFIRAYVMAKECMNSKWMLEIDEMKSNDNKMQCTKVIFGFFHSLQIFHIEILSLALAIVPHHWSEALKVCNDPNYKEWTTDTEQWVLRSTRANIKYTIWRHIPQSSGFNKYTNYLENEFL